METLRRLASWAIGVVGAMIAIAAQVSPEIATTNLSGWAKIVGLKGLADSLPAWADSAGTFAGIVLILAALSLALLMRHRRKRRPNVKIEATPPRHEWLGMMTAIDTFCDPDLVKLRDGYRNTSESCLENIFQTEF